MPEFDYCVLEKLRKMPIRMWDSPTTEKKVHCSNPEDRRALEDGLAQGQSFRRMREELGYAGKFKKIPGEKHDGIYCTDQNDALQIHLGLKDGHSVSEIVGELGYAYHGLKNAHGYTIQKLWHSGNYDIVVAPYSGRDPADSYRYVFLRSKDGSQADVGDLFWRINDHTGTSEDRFMDRRNPN